MIVQSANSSVVYIMVAAFIVVVFYPTEVGVIVAADVSVDILAAAASSAD